MRISSSGGTKVSGLKLLVCAALSYQGMRPYAISVCDLKLLVHVYETSV
jgi:hypothetical protein